MNQTTVKGLAESKWNSFGMTPGSVLNASQQWYFGLSSQ